MRKILLILCLTPMLTIGQNHYDICDKNEPLEQNWESKKSLFIPTDMDNYTLLFESMSLTEERNRRKIATEYYDISSDNGYSKKWLVEKGYFGVNQSKAIKRFKKLFPRKYYIVNTDSLNKYPIEQYPYMIRSYYEPIKMAGDNYFTWRPGYVIYDRRTHKAFPMIVGFKIKREKWIFKNL